FRVRCGHDCSDAGFAFRDGGERNTRSHYALFEQFMRKTHGELAVADNDGRNWSFAGGSGAAADVESQQAEFFFPEACVLPEFFYSLWFLFENLESGNARCRDCGRMRSREKNRVGEVAGKTDEVARAD